MSRGRERAVVITGASTGIGRACALALDRLGDRVFAGVRKEGDAESLAQAGSHRLTPIRLDVTEPASIEEAKRRVADAVGTAGLFALINNAGVLFAGPIEFLPLRDLRRQFDVNVFGPIAVTQAFLPLLRTGHGRIVNIGSIAGRVSAPFLGPLCASKFALEALTDALRLELHRWGIPVVLIEPGFVATEAAGKVETTARTAQQDLPPEGRALYGSTFERVMARAVRDNRSGVPPEAVVKVVARALAARRPRTRYPVGPDARVLAALARFLPDRILDRLRLRALGIAE